MSSSTQSARRYFTSVVMSGIMISGAGSLQAGEPDARAIDAVFAEYDSTRQPGCVLGIYRGGKIIYSQGYGMANLEQGIAIAPDSVFRLASVSKQFVAAAIALLAEQGQLDLDDPVQKYFPAMPEYDAPITLRQLVHHTSGIRDYLELARLAELGDHYQTDQALRLIERQQALNFTPGTDYLYSNSGYLLLGEVVHQVTGQTLREWTTEHIFQPLGMHDTRFQDNYRHLVPRRADGYAPAADGWEIDMTQQNMVGDGGLYSTVNDLLRWHNFFDKNPLGDGGEALIELMETSAVLENGEPADYGFGLSISEFMGTREVGHGGSWVGFRTALNRYPEADLGLAVLCNRADSNPGALARSVATLYLGDAETTGTVSFAEPERAPAVENSFTPSADELEAYVGTWWNEKDMLRRLIILEEGQLYYDRDGWGRSPLLPRAPGLFQMAEVSDQVEVRFAGDTATLAVNGEHLASLERYDPEALATKASSAITGTYYSPELDHTFKVVVEGNQPTAHMRWESKTLEPIPGDRFMLDGVVMAIERDAEGYVTGMQAHSGRVRNLAYERQPE